MLLAIDSGACTGWAYFSAQGLQACGLAPVAPDLSPEKVVIECPRLRPHGEKNPNSILLVARNAGEWGGRYMDRAEVTYVTPNMWKGSTPKKIDHARTLAKLTSAELLVLNTMCHGMAKGKKENVLDAIGIGLWSVGR